MIGSRRTTRLLPTALVALILLSASHAQKKSDFNFYPEGAQDCLFKAAQDSKCQPADVVATNSCLCRNGGNFITNAAACIGRSSPGDLKEVYRTMNEVACDGTETPISMTEEEFLAAANAATSTSTQGTDTATTTASNTGTATVPITTATTTTTAPPETSPIETTSPDDDQGGLSKGAVAGIAAAASILGVSLLGGLAYFLFHRRRKTGEESHPMLPQQAHISGRESSTYYSGLSGSGPWPKKDWGPSPDPSVRSSGFNWESPAHLSYPGSGALAPSPPLPVQELDSTEYHPTGTPAAPAEMGGTPVVATVPGNTQFRPYNPGQQYQGSAWGPPHR